MFLRGIGQSNWSETQDPKIGIYIDGAQARLLRILQVGEFSRVGGREIIKTDVRIIAATNVKLKQSVEKGDFREDLFYRLNVVNIDMPPLRKRISDIMTLAEFFLKKFSKTKKFNFDCQKVLEAYQWPGNVRELENLFKRVCALSTERIITGEILSEFLDKKETLLNNHEIQEFNVKSYSSLNVFLQEFLEQLFDTLENETEIQLFEKFISEVEKQLISKTLKYYSGNQIKSSKLLGINRNTLRSKMQKYKISTK